MENTTTSHITIVIDDFTYTVKFGKLKESDTLSLYGITG